MSIGELIQGVREYLRQGDANATAQLAQEAIAMSDMVSWATGQIDPQGRIGEKLQELKTELRAQHEAQPSDTVATLHDALAQLREAIIRHDLDLVGESDQDDTVSF